MRVKGIPIFGKNTALAGEEEIAPLFRDCAPGAVPAIGNFYALDAIIDESIDEQPEVYVEGGDHATLIHMDKNRFAQLTKQARRSRFSAHI